MAHLGLRKWGSQLTTIEQEKAKREQFRKEKLVSLLNQKLHRAFGLTTSHPVIEDEIESFVANNKEDFSMNKLKDLQNDIAARLAKEGITLKTKKEVKKGETTAKAGMGILGINDNKFTSETPKLLSRGSRHSMSQRSIAQSNGKGQNIRGSQMSGRSTSHKSLAESDEWREIQNFNTLLHLEEQNQEIQREKERQKMIKDALDGQIREKRERALQERKTQDMYDELQRQIMKEAEKKEQLRMENVRFKIQKDKEGRDRQVMMEKAIKQGEVDREKAQEAIIVSKLKKELELEKMAFKEQRNTRKRQMADMMAENSQAQFLAKVAQEKEREEDKRLQRDLMKVLDAQQSKDANDAKYRVEKQKVFVDKMANEVLTKVVERNKKEEEIIQRYTEERLMKEKLEEERRLRKQKQEQMDMKEYLSRQVKDKVKKEEIDKEVVEEQAKLWKMDRETFAKEEAELSKKMKDLSLQNSTLLQKQIEEAKNQKKGMDPIEYGINKTYLKGIRSKKYEILKEGV